MTIRSAPRPVSTPPTEVASRQPCAVVSNSAIACRAAESRVGKTRRYRWLMTMHRQSRDNLSASSCASEAHRRWRLGSCPRHQAGNATEANSDFAWRGGRLMISRRISRRRCAASPDGRSWGPFRGSPRRARMPAGRERGPRIKLGETGLRKTREIDSQQCRDFLGRGSRLRSCRPRRRHATSGRPRPAPPLRQYSIGLRRVGPSPRPCTRERLRRSLHTISRTVTKSLPLRFQRRPCGKCR